MSNYEFFTYTELLDSALFSDTPVDNTFTEFFDDVTFEDELLEHRLPNRPHIVCILLFVPYLLSRTLLISVDNPGGSILWRGFLGPHPRRPSLHQYCVNICPPHENVRF